MILQKNNQYAVECKTKMSSRCLGNGEYCDSEEEAVLWVEYECWIDSGEGWICTTCHEMIMNNLVKMRYQKEAAESQSEPEDVLSNDLEIGIDDAT